LEVTRFTPEGEVELAPALSITFSQPMVAVSSQEEAAAQVPVTLTPQPAGRWRWLGAQTLVFQPEAEGGRLPMATGYTVTIPAGTKSVLGNALAQTRTFNFLTPPVTLKNSYPKGTSQPRDALMFIEFDGRIDAARVLERLKLQPAVAGVRLRPATPEEIAADESIKNLVKAAQEGRWLALRAVGPDGATKDALPSDTDIKIVIPPGTPSAEGPRLTTGEQSFTFKTYGPLRVIDTACGYEKRCSPFDRLQLTFSNPLNLNNDAPATHVHIKPDIPGAQVSVSYNSIQIEGAKRGNTTYTVTLDRTITDTFGQTLTGENQFSFKVTNAAPRLFATGEGFVVLDPAGTRAFTVYTVNYSQLKVSLYKVAPADWPHFRAYQAWRQTRRNGQARGNGKVKETVVPPPGTLVFDKVVEVKAVPDQLTESLINLSPALDEGYGQVFVKVEPVEREEVRNGPINVYAYRQENRAEAWVQSTEIGLDAFTDNDNFVTWASSLKDGSPLAGVEVTASPDGLSGVTDSGGLARFAFKDLVNNKASQIPLLVARRGRDVAILPQTYHSYYYGGDERSSWRNSNAREELKWYVFDDRKLYRPGEEVSVKGWIRKVSLTPTGGTEMFTPDADEEVNYVLKDAQDNEV
ncbi:MAG: Ig-like domain-containing protein, partial [Pyrinomonadaceae bacterium]